MKRYRKTSHSLYDIKYHLVWITKYRRPVLYGNEAERARELIREVCNSLDVDIIRGHLSRDHVHLLVSVPPYLSVSKLMQHIKGKSSRKLLSESSRMRKQFWGRHMWARGYFACTTGNVTDEMIAQYIEKQDLEENRKTDDFQIASL